MPSTHQITITGGNSTTGRLTVPDIEAFSRDTIQWIISTSDVDSIEEISKKNIFIRNVWDTPPTKDNNWTGQLKQFDHIITYKYNIKWKKGDHIPPHHDPIISIKPHGIDFHKHFRRGSMLSLFIAFFLGGLGISYIISLLKKKNSS